jgi:hypothetical protein
MRIFLSCLLLGLLTACQTTRVSPPNVVAATHFPAEGWSSQTRNGDGGSVTVFACSEARCGKDVFVAISQKTLRQAGPSTEDLLRMRSFDDAMLKELLTLSIKGRPGSDVAAIGNVRKMNGDPVGFFVDGTITREGKIFSVAAEMRVRGNRLVTASAYAASAQTARNSLKFVNVPALLN